jgi:phage baseplate assembly protein W
MYGISPKLPLKVSTQDGPYGLTKSIGEAVKQNFKNLLLTSPGERIMLPEFGVGIKQFFFEQINPSTYEAITAKINEQVQRYLPFIYINEISYESSDTNPVLSFNELGVKITYSIPGINEEDTLQITATQNYL